MLKRSAGVLIPLFSIRTADDPGCGEIPGLSAMMDFALAAAHRVIQLLPINETAPSEASPYSALSLFAIDPIYIAAAPEGVDVSAPDGARGAASLGRVPRPRLHAAKLSLLDQAFRRFRSGGSAEEHAEFDAFAAKNGDWLHDYTLFRALKGRFSFASWETWPDGLKRRDPDALGQARRELGESIDKFCYFQFLAHRQWSAIRREAAARGAMLGGDLAFSPAMDSADVWAHQELFILDRTVGTPPDAFAAKGQRWGLPMPNWDRMRAEGLGWWRMRARHAAGLYDLFRVDHVVGLYRTFSFGPNPDEPGAFFPADEGAQRAQGEEVLRAIKEEAGESAIIAEDLGSIPPWVRQSLMALGLPGYKVFRWEKENWNTPEERFVSPSAYPELSIATTGTHDTDTLAAWWRDAPEHERGEVCAALGITDLNPGRRTLAPATLDAILRAVYAAPSILTLVPVQDLFGWITRINLPGTVSSRNWNYRLPFNLKPFDAGPAIKARLERLKAIAIGAGRF